MCCLNTPISTWNPGSNTSFPTAYPIVWLLSAIRQRDGQRVKQFASVMHLGQVAEVPRVPVRFDIRPLQDSSKFAASMIYERQPVMHTLLGFHYMDSLAVTHMRLKL